MERLEELNAVRFGEKSASRVPKVLLFGGNLFICYPPFCFLSLSFRFLLISPIIIIIRTIELYIYKGTTTHRLHLRLIAPRDY